MLVSHIRLLRRLLIAVIAVVLCVVAVNYYHTWRGRARIVKTAILGSEMIRSADSIEYSEHENGALRFKIRAEKLLETKLGKNHLQGIEAFDFSPDGAVRNEIRSRKAEYDREGKTAFFSGDVRIRIGKSMELRTGTLHYDLNANTGTTEDALQFKSDQIEGTARGIRYDHNARNLDLQHDVDLMLRRSVTSPDGSARQETLRGTSERGHYSESERIVSFQSNARLVSDAATLSGEDIEATFSADKKELTSLLAKGNAVYDSKDSSESRSLRGNAIVFGLSSHGGAPERIDVNGNAVFSANGSDSSQELKGETIHIELDPSRGLPYRVQSRSGVEFRIIRNKQETLVSGNELDAAFISGTSLLENMRVANNARLANRADVGATTSDELRAEEIRIKFGSVNDRSVPRELQADGSVQWSAAPHIENGKKSSGQTLSAGSLKMIYTSDGMSPESGTASGNVVVSQSIAAERAEAQVRRLQSDTAAFQFQPGDTRLRDFSADGHVQVTYQSPPDPAAESPAQEFRTHSSKLRAGFQKDGTLETASQWGNFVFQDSVRTATSGRSDYDGRTEILVMRDSPKISDPNGTTTGDLMEYGLKDKVLKVQGHVRSVLRARDGSGATPFAQSAGSSSPNVVTAQEMQYWTEDSKVRYAGNVQMLSENGQLQTRSLDLLQGGALVEGHGEVKHLIPRAEKSAGSQGRREKPGRSGSPILITSSEFRYTKAGNSVHYSGEVTLHSDDVDMASESLDASFDQSGTRIERATARGKLTIRQSDRRAKGDTADYYPAPEKFEVTGRPAEIEDPTRGKSLARRLTFFTADDRILLENR